MVLLLAALPYASTTEVIPQQRTLSRLCPWSTSQSCASSREVVSLRVSEGTVMVGDVYCMTQSSDIFTFRSEGVLDL